jgi:LmbE family N-acetylglucosaminyl deacetylase
MVRVGMALGRLLLRRPAEYQRPMTRDDLLPTADAPLTLMAVHAHPDDEATTTGGILTKYSAEGVRTVLVTCTNGELGDAPDGAKPDEEAHDEDAVIASRRRELEQSCRILGVRHLELLGFRDSGMMGWPSNEVPGAFWNVPVDEAAKPLAALMRRYRPDVVVTYDDFGFYGHPDHIQAHRITLAALDITESKARLYFPAIRRSRLLTFLERLASMGVEPPQVDERMGVPDELIAASVDCRDRIQAKREAMLAHGSQGENLFFLRMPESAFAEMLGVEEFVLARGTVDGPAPHHDLFTGLRDGATASIAPAPEATP